MDERLITEVSKHPCLYDSTSSGYRDSVMRENLWASIADDLGFTVEETRQRWKNLRDTFVRKRRKRKLNESRGMKDGRDWRYDSLMSFLSPFVQEKSPSVGRWIQDGCHNEDSECFQCAVEVGEDIPVIKTSPCPSPPARATCTSQTESSLERKSDFTVADDRRIQTPCTSNMSQGQRLSFDEDELFLMSLLPTFRRLEPRQKALAKIQIGKILFDAEFADGPL